MTGEDRRRKWSHAEREQILAAAFAPGAVVAKVARQFDVASSLIYTWRREAASVVTCKPVGFSPAILIEQAEAPVPDASTLLPPPLPSPASPKPVAPVAPLAITVEFSAGVRVAIDATAPTALVTATLLALQ
jgi:transposase